MRCMGHGRHFAINAVLEDMMRHRNDSLEAGFLSRE